MAGEDTDYRRLAGVMISGGVMHFVTPGTYEKVVPPKLGDARRLVLASGVAEVAAGALLLVPRTRRLGGWLTAAVLVAVFPANVQMALDAGTERQAVPKVPAGRFRAVALARLPLQVPLVARAVRIGRGR
jgi:uncharacterized membrane protein